MENTGIEKTDAKPSVCSALNDDDTNQLRMYCYLLAEAELILKCNKTLREHIDRIRAVAPTQTQTRGRF